MENELKQLIESANRILITSHISPDSDAVTSVLLIGTTLQKNFSQKNVSMVIEEQPSNDLSFLAGYGKITFKPLLIAFKELQPDLIIMADAMNYDRCSRADADLLRATVKASETKLVVIDHHQPAGIDENSLYLNSGNPATAQEVYETLFNKMHLQKPEGYAQTTLLGIISDTARFKYDNPRHHQTFQIVSELLDAGASIEQLENQTERYTAKQLKAFARLADNIKDSGHGYTFAYVDTKDVDDLPDDEDKKEALKSAAEIFTSQFARNFEGNNWGFVIYPDMDSGQGVYALSLRSVSGGIDVSALANNLGGGGHKQAAGAKIKAASALDALAIVEQSIREKIS